MKKNQIIISGLYIIVLTAQSFASSDVNQFCFKDNTQEEKKIVESNLITVKGIDSSVPVEIKGSGDYTLNGRYMGREKSMVKNGDQIRVRQESLSEDGGKISTMLIVGNTYDVFTTVTNRGNRTEDEYRISSSPCQR